MKYLNLILILIIFASCGKDEPSGESKNIPDTTKIAQSGADKDITEAEQKASPDSLRTGLHDVIYNFKEIPSELRYDGYIITAAKWDDDNGSNILLISEKKQSKEDKDGNVNSTKNIYAYQYRMKDTVYEQLWRVNDFINNCEFDLTLEYIMNSLTITDLDTNGIAENTFLYRMACRSDVSPAELKLIMHEGKTKYAIRGKQVIIVPGEEPYGGEMKPDVSFKKAPKQFLEHAEKEWDEYKEEKFK